MLVRHNFSRQKSLGSITADYFKHQSAMRISTRIAVLADHKVIAAGDPTDMPVRLYDVSLTTFSPNGLVL